MDSEGEWLEMNNLSAESEKDYKLLLQCIKKRHLAAFKSLAQRALRKHPPTINIDYHLPYPHDKTFLDIACSEGLVEFVAVLLELGANPNRENEVHKRAPLHFAVARDHEQVLKVLLEYPFTNPNFETSQQITALHMAIKNKNIKCVELLLEYGANPNALNSKLASPLHLAAVSADEEIVKMILEKSKVPSKLDVKGFRRQTVREALGKYLPDVPLPPPREEKDDFTSLRYYLQCNDEDKFLKSLKSFDEPLNNIEELIRIASRKNLGEAVQVLLEKSQDQQVPLNLSGAAEAAAREGNQDILEVLLKKIDPESKGKLLILICQELSVGNILKMNQRLKCMELLLSQRDININERDDIGNTALHYAVRSESEEAVNLLLQNSKRPYIGHMNVFGFPPIANMSLDSLNDFFDSCISSKKEGTDDYEIMFDYTCLMPGQSKYKSEQDEEALLGNEQSSNLSSNTEMTLIQYISEQKVLRNLLMHPLISSFLYLKWHRIRHMYYLNFLIYFFYFLAMNFFIILNEEDPTSWLGIAVMVSLAFLGFRELIQFISAPCHYLNSHENWLEVTLIVLSICQLAIPSSYISTGVILLSAWELVLLIGTHPSMSTGIEMFKTVSVNFIKFLFLYLFLILAFAMAFYNLFKDEENFANPGTSLFKTIIMLTGEFDASSVEFGNYPIFGHVVFILFVFFMAIVLFNLLNGLAVSDTSEILGKAKLVGLMARTKQISYVENISSDNAPPKSPLCCFCPQTLRCTSCKPLGFLKDKVSLFSNYMPFGKFSVKPFKFNEIIIDGDDTSEKKRSTLKMEQSITEEAREILSNRNHRSVNERLLEELSYVRTRLDYFENAIRDLKLETRRTRSPEAPSITES